MNGLTTIKARTGKDFGEGPRMTKQSVCVPWVIALMVLSAATQAGNNQLTPIGDFPTTNEGVPVAIDVTANDVINLSPVGIVIKVNPVNGVLAVANNIVTYTP